MPPVRNRGRLPDDQRPQSWRERLAALRYLPALLGLVWDTNRGAEVLSALSPCRLVVKGGRVTAEIAHTIAELWRQPLRQPTGTS